MGAVIAPGGRKSPKGCYYLHIDPNGAFLAGGMYMPMPDVLKNIRQEIDYNLKEFEKTVNHSEFKRFFNGLDDQIKLKTVPKGYSADNPAIEFLKLKSFTVSSPLDNKTLNSKELIPHCLEVFAAIRPLNHFLNRAVELVD